MRREEGVSVVILTWNGLAILKKSLDSVVKATNQYNGKIEIIIVDNGSQDRTVDVIKDFYPSIKVVALDKNTGFSKGNNIGATSAQYDKLFFLNNDVILPEDFFNVLLEDYKKITTKNDIFSLSPQTNYWRGKELTEDVFCGAIGFDLDSGEIRQKFAVHEMKNTALGVLPTAYGSGAALLVDRKKFEEINGFPEIYTPAYWEDFDLCYHAWKRGWASYYTSNTVVWHQISATSASLDSSFKRNLMLRNFYIFNLLNFDSKKYVTSFLIKSFVDSLTRLANGNKEGRVFFKTMLEHGLEIMKERKLRKSKYTKTDKEIEQETTFDGKFYHSPVELKSNVNDLFESLIKE